LFLSATSQLAYCAIVLEAESHAFRAFLTIVFCGAFQPRPTPAPSACAR
jgi:hypothetical protein